LCVLSTNGQQKRPISATYGRQGREKEVPQGGLDSLELQFRRDELESYTEYRKTELTRKSADWINRASIAFWLSTFGTISARTLTDLRVITLAKYESEDSKSKVFTFAVAFLKHLAKTHLDIRYRSFELFLERPRRVKVRKNVTNRIVTKEDMQSVIAHIHHAESRGIISKARAEQYTAFTIFVALQLDNLDKFFESNGQINSRSKSSPEPVISSKHPKKRWARPIRTGDLRRVQTEDSGLFDAFSVGDRTMRKASDPSYIV
jgi:hypothetical protein